MTQPPAPFPAQITANEQAIARKALERVRAILKGNGVRQDSIAVIGHKISHHAMNAGTYLELKPASSERTAPGKLMIGHMVNSREDAARAVDRTMIQAANDPAAKARIASLLLSRPDHGFGLSRQAIPLEFLKQEYTWHESCHACQGSSRSPCQRCQGRKTEPCTKCSGRSLMPCPLCRTTGLLQGQKCTQCHGQRYVPCNQCQRSGMMSCRMCQATGVMKCQTCGGQGWKTHILTLSAQAMTYFEYDGKSIPKAAADMIETQAASLVTQQRIKVRGRIADEKENVLGANYEVEFPYGDVIFSVGKKEVKAGIFGLKGDLVDFPYILDRLTTAAVQDLEDAARDVGNVAAKIRSATRYRVIAQGFLLASKTDTKKAAGQLMKLYDIGLSHGTAEKIIVLADKTTSRITRKPRYYGLAAGLTIAAILDYIYYVLPLRTRLAGYLPDIRFDVVLDILPLLLGGVITSVSIQITAKRAIKKALSHLFQKNKDSALVPKTRSSGLWGWAGTIFIMLCMMEYAATTSGTAPYWYEILRNLVARITG